MARFPGSCGRAQTSPTPQASTTPKPKRLRIQRIRVTSMNAPRPRRIRLRPFLDPRCGHQQASHDRRAEISGGGHEAARQPAHGNQAQSQPTGVGLDSDRRDPAANHQGHQRMAALVHPGGEELERIEEIRRPRREADDQRKRNRGPQPVSDRGPREEIRVLGTPVHYGSVAGPKIGQTAERRENHAATCGGEATPGSPHYDRTMGDIELGLDTFGDLTMDDAGQPHSHAQVLRQVVEQAVLADQVGLAFIGVGEHHRRDFAVSAPEVVLAAIAGRTSRIHLGSSVTVLSTDDPVRVFERFSTLNALSNGRAEVIIGRGSFTESFPLFGFDLQQYDILFQERTRPLRRAGDQAAGDLVGAHPLPASRPDWYSRRLNRAPRSASGWASAARRSRWRERRSTTSR